jgi:hypothetical protein
MIYVMCVFRSIYISTTRFFLEYRQKEGDRFVVTLLAPFCVKRPWNSGQNTSNSNNIFNLCAKRARRDPSF